MDGETQRRGAQRLDVALYYEQPKRWAERAACHDQTKLFVIPSIRRGRPRVDEILINGKRIDRAREERIAKVKEICGSCPVLEECRQWAMSDPDPAEWMMAGGLTFDERSVLRFELSQQVSA